MTDNKEQFLGGDHKAIPYEDFVAIPETVLEFAHQETEKEVEITLLNKDDTSKPEIKENEAEEEEHSVKFYLKIFDAKPEGVKVSMKNICLVEIVPDSKDSDLEREKQAKTIIDMVLANRNPTYSQQFKNAIILGPTINEDDMIDDVTCGEAFTHLLTMPWKLLFALVPPKHHCGGWAAFFVALSLIGIITGIVGELANLLGCVLNLKVSVTAITFVALGTSLPDTFASQTAARTSQYADSAIGNVTGSNAVNVFLGLGLPWVIAAIYNESSRGTPYFVPAGNLGFSVIMFLSCATCCFMVLIGRRCVIGAELGGPAGSRYCTATICVVLWLIYIIMNTLSAYGAINFSVGTTPGPFPQWAIDEGIKDPRVSDS